MSHKTKQKIIKDLILWISFWIYLGIASPEKADAFKLVSRVTKGILLITNYDKHKNKWILLMLLFRCIVLNVWLLLTSFKLVLNSYFVLLKDYLSEHLQNGGAFEVLVIFKKRGKSNIRQLFSPSFNIKLIRNTYLIPSYSSISILCMLQEQACILPSNGWSAVSFNITWWNSHVILLSNCCSQYCTQWKHQ